MVIDPTHFVGHKQKGNIVTIFGETRTCERAKSCR